MNSQQNLAVFLPATDSEHKIIQILHRKGQNKILTELSSLGQEPTFNTYHKNTIYVVKNFKIYHKNMICIVKNFNTYHKNTYVLLKI